MKPWYLPLPSSLNLNACNLPPTQRDIVKCTKCTVGKRETWYSFPRGHPECRYTQWCRWPPRGRDETHPYEKKREWKTREGSGTRQHESWIENLMIVMHDLVFKRWMRLNFYWPWKFFCFFLWNKDDRALIQAIAMLSEMSEVLRGERCFQHQNQLSK